MINRILKSPIYAGNMVLNKYVSNLKLKKMEKTKVGDYEILKDTHPAIISQEDFDQVQKIKSGRIKNEKTDTDDYLLTIILQRGLPSEMKLPSSRPADIHTLSEAEFTDKLEKGYSDLQAG